MLERHDWVVPQFNYTLRVDKPVLLYWLEMIAYRTFGINELVLALAIGAGGHGRGASGLRVGYGVFAQPPG